MLSNKHCAGSGTSQEILQEGQAEASSSSSSRGSEAKQEGGHGGDAAARRVSEVLPAVLFLLEACLEALAQDTQAAEDDTGQAAAAVLDDRCSNTRVTASACMVTASDFCVAAVLDHRRSHPLLCISLSGSQPLNFVFWLCWMIHAAMGHSQHQLV